MNATGSSSEAAQSAMAANFTAFPSRTRSLLFCELHLHLQLGVLRPRVLQLAAQPDQFGSFRLVQRRVRRLRRLGVLLCLLQSGSPGEFHPRAPTEPCVTVSRHTALVI